MPLSHFFHKIIKLDPTTQDLSNWIKWSWMPPPPNQIICNLPAQNKVFTSISGKIPTRTLGCPQIAIWLKGLPTSPWNVPKSSPPSKRTWNACMHVSDNTSFEIIYKINLWVQVLDNTKGPRCWIWCPHQKSSQPIVNASWIWILVIQRKWLKHCFILEIHLQPHYAAPKCTNRLSKAVEIEPHWWDAYSTFSNTCGMLVSWLAGSSHSG